MVNDQVIPEENKTEVKDNVQAFYNEIGWQRVGQGMYQNTTYEDLRPVSRDYIHKCHMRVLRHLVPNGKLFLDAGSGPIQYPQYLEYSRGYQYRVCADISSVALKEARNRIGDHGLFVVVDIANLPFKPKCFDGVVSLHTIHHLPEKEHAQAYAELFRVLAPNRTAVVVDGWSNPILMRLINPVVNLLRQIIKIITGQTAVRVDEISSQGSDTGKKKPRNTHVKKYSASWLKETLGTSIPHKIFTWRSVNVRFLRVVIHGRVAGRWLLKVLFWLEEQFPHFLGENGQYPLVVIRRPKEQGLGE